MKQGRTPDRVHVVRPPEEDLSISAQRTGMSTPPLAPSLPGAANRDTRSMEIVRTLAQISDKLKRSEAERYELLAELREYRKSLIELEDKAEKSEKAYLALETQIKSRGDTDVEVTQRQARFERALKETESKLIQTVAGQALLDKRVKDTEESYTAITQRIDTTITEQARIDRQIEKIGDDRARTLRKVERMEEILTETQDTLKARALVLLTDQSNAAAQIPALGSPVHHTASGQDDAPWWRKSVRMQGVGMASMLVAALLFGWTINQVQQPEIPRIAVLENGGLARVNLEENRWEAIPNAQSAAGIAPSSAALEDEPAALPQLVGGEAFTDAGLTEGDDDLQSAQTEAAQQVLSSSDEELLAALEENPDQLAAQLNEIAPEARAALENIAPATPAPRSVAQQAATSSSPLEAFAATAFRQNPAVANEIARDKGAGTVAERIIADPNLPEPVAAMQAQAYNGSGTAQHDLAALYTAGRDGVNQNFERAAQWFREAADNGISNAAYNLGVLYHQGLGVDKDLDRALYWYREAARQGHPEAQYNLGIASIEGIGTTYDAPLAAAFFESAANMGVVEAAYNLGLIHENNLIGGNAKQEDAIMWYKIAADGNNTDARAALRQMAGTLQIGMDDIDKMAERMKSIYRSTHGRTAGGDEKRS